MTEHNQEQIKNLLNFLKEDDDKTNSFASVKRDAEMMEITPGIYCANHYGFAACYAVCGEKGLFFIDTTERMDIAAKVKEDYFKIPYIKERSPPIVGMAYTHFHADHQFGARELYSEFINEEDKSDDWSGPPIFASEVFMDSEFQLNGHTRPFYMLRGARMYGMMLTHIENMVNKTNHDSDVTAAKWKSKQEFGTLYPTNLVPNDGAMHHLMDLGDMNIYAFCTPGETPCHMSLWIPEKEALFVGDNVYFMCPNLTTLRGAPPRDPLKWISSLDRYIKMRPKHLLYGHGNQESGYDNCQKALKAYRYGIKYIHDQTEKIFLKNS